MVKIYSEKKCKTPIDKQTNSCTADRQMTILQSMHTHTHTHTHAQHTHTHTHSTHTHTHTHTHTLTHTRTHSTHMHTHTHAQHTHAHTCTHTHTHSTHMHTHTHLPVQAESDVGEHSAARVVGEEGVQALAGDAQRGDGPAVRALLPQGRRAVTLRAGGEPCVPVCQCASVPVCQCVSVPVR
jgi:hypothetical protein